MSTIEMSIVAASSRIVHPAMASASQLELTCPTGEVQIEPGAKIAAAMPV